MAETSKDKLDQLLERFEAADKVALARLITLIENRAAEVSRPESSTRRGRGR